MLQVWDASCTMECLMLTKQWLMLLLQASSCMHFML